MELPPGAATRNRGAGWVAMLVAGLVLCCGGAAGAADGPRILRLRHFTGPQHTRIVLDLDRAGSFEVRRIEDPDRIAVNLPGAVFAGGRDRIVNDGLVAGIRSNAGSERAQVVIDLIGRREFRAFSLPPAAGKPDRIVIDILRGGDSALPRVTPATEDSAVTAGADGAMPEAAQADASIAETSGVDALPAVAAGGASPDGSTVASVSGTSPQETSGEVRLPAAPVGSDRTPEVAEPPRTTVPLAGDEEPFVVVIDPGHGGDDPGAIRGSVLEKDICLDIGREVARLLARLPGYRVVLTRDRDRTLALGRRVEIARREKGDVFLSIHCNTHPRPAVSGMEVYFLSLQGATDREARELADKENAAGLVGLTPGEDHADLVVDILMDLKMTRVLQDSGRLAASLLQATDRSGVVPGRRVKQAGFQVLKSLAMPSALIEVAYLSNPDDCRLLTDPAGRRRLAGAIVAGLEEWRGGAAPLKARTAPVIAARSGGEDWETVYRVRSGDSLWNLADKYGTTMNEIARRNNLSERQRELRIGQRLRLPASGVRP